MKNEKLLSLLEGFHPVTAEQESHNLKWIPLSEITSDQFEESVYRMAEKTKVYL